MTRKTYRGPLVDVSFNGTMCRHAGECVRGMPEVFDAGAGPWINPEVASTADTADRLREAVGRCPSGAPAMVEHPED